MFGLTAFWDEVSGPGLDVGLFVFQALCGYEPESHSIGIAFEFLEITFWNLSFFLIFLLSSIIVQHQYMIITLLYKEQCTQLVL